MLFGAGNHLALTPSTMYSVYARKESAHEDSIWTCAWGRRTIRSGDPDDDGGGDSGDKEQETRTVDVLATGGVDDLVKVWEYDDGELKLRHKLGDHSLGVVSVALSKDAERE